MDYTEMDICSLQKKPINFEKLVKHNSMGGVGFLDPKAQSQRIISKFMIP